MSKTATNLSDVEPTLVHQCKLAKPVELSELRAAQLAQWWS